MDLKNEKGAPKPLTENELDILFGLVEILKPIETLVLMLQNRDLNMLQGDASISVTLDTLQDGSTAFVRQFATSFHEQLEE